MIKIRRSLIFLLTATLVLLLSMEADSSQLNRRTPIVDAVEKTLPSVVHISTTKQVKVSTFPMRTIPREFFFPFEDMFETRYQLQGLGSGVVVDGGYVVTNHHVIAGEYGPADQILVTAYDEQRQLEAVIVGSDPKADVAILEVDWDTPPPALAWGRSDDLMIGETVIAIGSSLGQPFTVTDGIISALNRSIDAQGQSMFNLIQTNAAINRGNSGGPLININGEFIGLNTAILTPTGASVGLGFAIPTSRVRNIHDYWVNGLIPLDDRLGIEIADMDARLDHFYRSHFPELEEANLEGVVVVNVSPDGLSQGALERRDLIRGVNNQPITSSDELLARLEEHDGRELRFDVIREGGDRTVSIASPSQYVETLDFFGLTMQIVDNPWRRWISPPRNAPSPGVVVRGTSEDAALAREGVQRGYILHSVGRMEIRTLDDLRIAERQIREGGRTTLRFLRRDARGWTTETYIMEISQSL